MNTQGINGRLKVELRHGEIVPALQRNTILTEGELHVAQQMSFDEHEPVIISFYEYYRFLDRLVRVLLENDIVDCILIRLTMPSTIGIPLTLLDDRVAIFHDIRTESEYLVRAKRDHLAIDADFKLYSWSNGKNEFTIRYLSPNDRSLSEDEMRCITEVITSLPAEFSVFQTHAEEPIPTEAT